MENTIPTAEEFTKSLLTEIDNCRGIRVQSVVVSEKFIEFAKLHVKAALKEASELEETNGTHGYKIYPESILNAYPLDNIK